MILSRNFSVLDDYREQTEERAKLNIVPTPLDADEVSQLCELLKEPIAGEEEYMMHLLEDRVPPGVDEAAYVKASFLASVANGEVTSPLVSKEHAVYLLGTMQGGYNIQPMIQALSDEPALAEVAVSKLANTLLMFDAFYDVEQLHKDGNVYATEVMQKWADASWFVDRPPVAEKMTVAVFMVTGETNTDDLSPAPDAWSRPDIPLHAKAMFKIERDGIHDNEKQSRTWRRQRASQLRLWVMLWARDHRASPPPTLCCGTWVMMFHTSLTSAEAACALAARLLLSSSTPWRIRVRCQLRWTSQTSAWEM